MASTHIKTDLKAVYCAVFVAIGGTYTLKLT